MLWTKLKSAFRVKKESRIQVSVIHLADGWKGNAMIVRIQETKHNKNSLIINLVPMRRVMAANMKSLAEYWGFVANLFVLVCTMERGPQNTIGWNFLENQISISMEPSLTLVSFDYPHWLWWCSYRVRQAVQWRICFIGLAKVYWNPNGRWHDRRRSSRIFWV